MVSHAWLASRRLLEPTLRYWCTASNAGTNKGLERSSIIRARRVEVWTTPCIVTHFGRRPTVADVTVPNGDETNKGNVKWILVNPSNPGLTGCRKFPYFPRGGPVPKEAVTSAVHKDWQPLGYVSQWGGMDVGSGMMYAVSVVDGLVHLNGGWQLQAELEWIRVRRHEACPVGTAVTTSAGNDTLALNYNAIIHTTPPFYKYSANPESELLRCYESMLEHAFTPPTTMLDSMFQTSPRNVTSITNVAVPLLGSGARGFPVLEGCKVATKAMAHWLQSHSQPDTDRQNDTPREHVVAFGIIDPSTADALNIALTSELGRPSA